MNNLTMKAICEYIYIECGDVELDEDGLFSLDGASDDVREAATMAFIEIGSLALKELMENHLSVQPVFIWPLIIDVVTGYLRNEDIDEAMPEYLHDLWAGQSVDNQINEARELDND